MVTVTPFEEIPLEFIEPYSSLLNSSFSRLLKENLSASENATEISKDLYYADFALLSHDGAEDPCFNYANAKAQELFEFDWFEFQGMPSRLSAEPDLREEREKMLEIATKNGFYTGYKGVRISKSGRRFFIDNCTIFNLLDRAGKKIGQAATFTYWKDVN